MNLICGRPNFRRKALILNDNCHSKFDVKIKLDTPNTREKDPLIREGFLTIVKITWCHSHTIANENVDSLYKLKTSPATEAAFYSYFEMGMSISEAKEYHKEVLQSQPDYDPGITLADVSQNPKERVIINLHSKWKVEYSESPFAIAIVTPITERVHEEEMSKHVAFVDSSASCDLDNHSVTFLLTLSPAGALPLGLVITEKQSQKSYAKGFQLLKEIVGDDGFGGQGFPTVFMTDDSTAERSALKEVWPESQQKLCQFHASQSATHRPSFKVRRIDHYNRIALIALGEKAPKPEFYMVPPSELSELSEQRRKSLEIESMEAGEDEENQEESVFVPQFDPQEILKQREIFISTLYSAVENLPMDDPSAHTAIKNHTAPFIARLCIPTLTHFRNQYSSKHLARVVPATKNRGALAYAVVCVTVYSSLCLALRAPRNADFEPRVLGRPRPSADGFSAVSRSVEAMVMFVALAYGINNLY